MPVPITYKLIHKRGRLVGSLVSEDLSEHNGCSATNVSQLDVETMAPGAILPTAAGQTIVTPKGDWNTINSFRPEFVKITFNLSMEDISPCILQGPGHPGLG